MRLLSPTAALSTLSLSELEEAGGELTRRIAVALRSLGESGADRLTPSEKSSDSEPRRCTARLAALLELTATALAAAVGTAPENSRGGIYPRAQTKALETSVMYAAPTIDALLTRLEQDRRLLVSLARAVESQLAERHPTPLGMIKLRTLVTEMAITEPARTAQALERALAAQRNAKHAATET